MMKKMYFLLVAMGLGVLLMSSGVDAISVKLVDGADPITGNYDNTVSLLFTNLSPYKFGYIDAGGVFNSIMANGWTPISFNVSSASVVDLVLAITSPLTIFAAGAAEYFSPINPASTAYTYGMLTFSTPNGPTGIAIAT